jgi:hypothetical protein
VAEVEFSQLPHPAGLIEVSTVLDIGAGLRPFGWYKPKQHICVEPHEPYADRLREAGYWVWGMTAVEALDLAFGGPPIDAVYLLDVIEHMPRGEGEHVLEMARRLNPRQIIVSTPNGFLAQHGDAWGLGGEHWQEHRSGWAPADFPGWTISYYDNGAPCGGFTAVSS